jgi:recombination protein RecA
MAKKDINEDIKDTAKKMIDIVGLSEVKNYISTGCTLLDAAIANQIPGGIPQGRVTQFYGGGSTAKSVLASIIMGYAQRNGFPVYYADVEHTLDSNFIKIFGVDVEKVNVLHPATLEEFFDVCLSDVIYDKTPTGRIKGLNKTPKVMIVDSVTALPSEPELTEELTKGSYGPKSKQMSRAWRKWLFALSESNTTLICIDQTRDNIGAGPFCANKEVTSGGRGLEFYASVRVHLKHVGKILNTKDSPIGIWVEFDIAKNKVAPPFKKGRFKILFDHGLDNICSNLRFISFDQNGEQKCKNATQTIELWGEKKTQAEWVHYIEENNKEYDLQDETWKVWQEIHKTEVRKPRVW